MGRVSTQKPGIALVALHAGYCHSSLALRSIAAYCRDEPYYSDISLYEPTVQSDHQWLLATLEENKPRIIGFSTYLWNIQASIRLARTLKKLLPDTRIIFGGPEAGPRAEQLLENVPALDFVIDGEGEHAFRDLARWCLYCKGTLRAVSGLTWRDGGNHSIRNAIRPLPVEELPSPFTAAPTDFTKPLIYWETSRGCPYRCTFCTSATDRTRTIPWKRLEVDLEIISKLENKTVKLLDRSFHLGTARTIRLLERFLDTPESLRFHLELNPDRISPEAMDLFSRAGPGKFQFEIGLQTLDEHVLEQINRQMDVPHSLDTIRTLVALKKHSVHLDLIAGLPEEYADGCRDSLDRVFLLFPHHLQLGTLKLLPGTPLREQADRFGYIWIDEPPYEILGHNRLGFREINRLKHYAELLERLWNNGLLVNTLIRLVPEHSSGSVSKCFDDMLDRIGERLATERMQPESVLALVTDFLLPHLADDPVLRELLLWDYARHSLVTRETPEWIRERLQTTTKIKVSGNVKRLSVISLSRTAAEIVNRRLLEPLNSGRYALWPRRHQKGRPVQVFALEA